MLMGGEAVQHDKTCAVGTELEHRPVAGLASSVCRSVQCVARAKGAEASLNGVSFQFCPTE